MKKIIGIVFFVMGIVATGHAVSAPREVVSCSEQVLFGISNLILCYGDIENIRDHRKKDKENKGVLTTITELYHDGWKIDSDISRSNSFTFILSREKAKVKK